MENQKINLVIEDSVYQTLPTNAYKKALKWKKQESNKITAIIPGTIVEIFVKEALGIFGILAETPSTKTKKHKSAGYPDLLLIFENTPFYLECKTFNEDTVSSSQRSFYLSPSEDFKVIYDAPHLVLSYEIYSDYTIGGNLVYKCKTYKILSIEKLLVDVKYEFNSDNNRLYSYNHGTILLAEGIV
ncbi:MAG: hypothetical protein SNJ71_04825 [Bacteroidales bacterium]